MPSPELTPEQKSQKSREQTHLVLLLGVMLAVGALDYAYPAISSKPGPNDSILCKGSIAYLAQIMDGDSIDLLYDESWTILTGVLRDDSFARGSLRLYPWNVEPFCQGNISAEEVRMEGTLTGNTKQLGVHFEINFPRSGPNLSAQTFELQLQSAVLTEGVFGERKDSVGIGMDRTRSSLRMDYHTGEVVSSDDLEKMRQRISNIKDVLKTHLRIPESAIFIPDKHLNGITTFVNHKTGYGLYVTTEGDIHGYTVSVRIVEALLGDEQGWRDVAQKYGVDPKYFSFPAILKGILQDLDRWNWVMGHLGQPQLPGTEDLNKLRSGLGP